MVLISKANETIKIIIDIQTDIEQKKKDGSFSPTTEIYECRNVHM